MAVGPLCGHLVALSTTATRSSWKPGPASKLPRLLRRTLSTYEGRLARRAVALVTVNEGYAGVLQADSGHIARDRSQLPAALDAIRRAGIAAPRGHRGFVPQPLILYHGGFSALAASTSSSRLCSSQVLSRPTWLSWGSVQLGRDSSGCARDPRFQGRLHVLDAVPPGELLEWVAGADVDVIPLQRSTLNHWLCTPNKLWESLAVGVPVVVSDFPVMRRIVLEDPAGPLGGVCDPANRSRSPPRFGRSSSCRPTSGRRSGRDVSAQRMSGGTGRSRGLDWSTSMRRSEPQPSFPEQPDMVTVVHDQKSDARSRRGGLPFALSQGRAADDPHRALRSVRGMGRAPGVRGPFASSQMPDSAYGERLAGGSDTRPTLWPPGPRRATGETDPRGASRWEAPMIRRIALVAIVALVVAYAPQPAAAGAAGVDDRRPRHARWGQEPSPRTSTTAARSWAGATPLRATSTPSSGRTA